MELAVKVEERNRVKTSSKQSWSSVKTGTFSASTRAVSSYSSVPPTSPTTNRSWGSISNDSHATVQSPKAHSVNSTLIRPTGDFRRLTDKELQEKRSKGICFRFDDKRNIGHRCIKKELSVILIDENEEGDTDEGSTEPPMSPTKELTTEVSLNSVVGLSNPRTMKLRGKINDKDVVVLVDLGVTHNFVSLNIVGSLGLIIDDMGSFGNFLGNGDSIKGQGVCREVGLYLDGQLMVCEDFLPLELGSSDVTLGVQWLEKLGPVTTNWRTQVMKFEVGGSPVTLVGDPSLVHSKISLKAIYGACGKREKGFGWSVAVWRRSKKGRLANCLKLGTFQRA